jgi:hypothetical protein
MEPTIKRLAHFDVSSDGKLVGRRQQPQKRLPRKVDAAPAPAKNEVGHRKLVSRRQQPQKKKPRKVDAAPAPEKMRSATENLSAVASSLKKAPRPDSSHC